MSTAGDSRISAGSDNTTRSGATASVHATGGDVVALHSAKSDEFYSELLLPSRGNKEDASGSGSSSSSSSLKEGDLSLQAPSVSCSTLQVAAFVLEQSELGYRCLTALDYDVCRLFTPGLRPEVRREHRVLFACLDRRLALPESGRIRQQFNSEVDAASHEFALLVFMLEVWCPGSLDVSLLCNAACVCLEGNVSSSSSGALSLLLVKAQGVVSELRPDFRAAVRGAALSTPSWLSRSAACNYHVSMMRDALAILRQCSGYEGFRLSKTIRSCPANNLSEGQQDAETAVGLHESLRSEAGAVSMTRTAPPPSQQELATQWHKQVAAHYSAMSLQRCSPLTQRVVRFVALSQHSLMGQRYLVSLHGDMKKIFAPGSRPEVKREYRVLFAWHRDEVLRPSYRYRQQFGTKEEAEKCQEAILTLLLEVWRPTSVPLDALRRACCSVRCCDQSLLFRKSGKALASCFSILREVVMELRSDVRVLDNTRGGEATPCDAALAWRSIKRARGSTDTDGAAALAASPGHAPDTRAGLLPETARAVWYVKAHAAECTEELSEIRQSDGACLFDPAVCDRYRVLFGWFRFARGDGEPHEGKGGREFSMRELCVLSNASRMSIYLYTVELWEANSVSLELLRCGAYVDMAACEEQRVVRELLGELQSMVLDLRHDFCSSILL